MRTLTKTLCRLLDAGEDLVVATILTRSGSAPRTAGTKMIIRENGDIFGTIGGGLVEARAQQIAPKVHVDRKSQIFLFDMTGEQAATMDMICGGEMEILLEHIPANEENRTIFREWLKALTEGRQSFLVTSLKPDEADELRHRCLLREDATIIGPALLEPELAENLRKEAQGKSFPIITTLPQGTFYLEPSSIPATLYLFGAGHVCQPTAALAATVGFRIVVLDDREEFANCKRFPTADDIRVVPAYDDCMADLPIDSHSYLVIISRGHRHDQTLLRQSLGTGAGYIGMIGSRGKRDKIYRNLLAEGVRQKVLDKVHAPIGMAIEAETPEEIAVSIVGELILARARNQVTHG